MSPPFQVRQNPKIGAFYVQGLKFVAVGSYKEIEARTEEGRKSLCPIVWLEFRFRIYYCGLSKPRIYSKFFKSGIQRCRLSIIKNYVEFPIEVRF